MEKIYVKPISKELIHKNAPGEGHTDIFSYNAEESPAAEKLGSLFVIGHVQHETDDVAYMVNLVAALAKREYYARPAAGPKESFASTLKKINEVIQDFFKNSGLTVNVGIFAIADDHIFISRLGKFKIVLARGGKNVDVLNNIELFEKEHIQEREFSNIISGKILEGDRILAFYPAQPIASRERFIKSYFLKLTEVDFILKINQIKTANPAFFCALLYIDMHKMRRAAVEPKIQPQELQVNLAAQEHGQSSAVPPRPSKIRTARELSAELAAASSEPVQKPEYRPPAPLPDIQDTELPRIIPAEFSIGKRESVSHWFFRRLAIPGINLRNRFFVFGAIAVGIIGLVVVTKTFFIIDPEVKQLNAALDGIQANIKVAKDKIGQNSAGEARVLLLSSLQTIRDIGATDEDKVQDAKDELFEILDGIDQAQDTSPILIQQLAPEAGLAKFLAASGADLYVYTKQDQSGFLLTIRDGAIQDTREVKDIQPSEMLAASASPLLLSMPDGKVGYLKKGELATAQLAVPAPIVAGGLYQDNLYLLATDNIYKVTDGAKGGTKSSVWLKEGAPAEDSSGVAVDGSVFTLSRSGTITVFYKGAKSDEFRTGLLPGPDSQLLTTLDSLNLHLVERSLNRIYVLDKKTGALVKTYRIDSPVPITDAALDPSDNLFFLTADNKVWKLQ